jgi:hypothetical protein
MEKTQQDKNKYRLIARKPNRFQKIKKHPYESEKAEEVSPYPFGLTPRSA